MMSARPGYRRVLTEAAIDRAARHARDRIMKFGFEPMAKMVRWDSEKDVQLTRREFRRRIYDDVRDSVRLNSRFERRKK